MNLRLYYKRSSWIKKKNKVKVRDENFMFLFDLITRLWKGVNNTWNYDHAKKWQFIHYIHFLCYENECSINFTCYLSDRNWNLIKSNFSQLFHSFFAEFIVTYEKQSFSISVICNWSINCCNWDIKQRKTWNCSIETKIQF